MTSVSRAFTTLDAKTKFVAVKSLSYSNAPVGHNLLVPFTYSNQTLDISPVPGFVPSNGDGSSSGQVWRTVQVFGTTGPVTDLDPTFLEWFYNFDDVDTGSVSVYTPATMMKVQYNTAGGNSGNEYLNVDYGYESGATVPPSGSEFISGSAESNFDTVYIFKTPLVLKYNNVGTPSYATFSSLFAHHPY